MAEDPRGYADYNQMQISAGLMPPFAAMAPQMPMAGQISAQIAQNGLAALGGFQQPFPTIAGGPMFMPGPGGMLMPMGHGGPNQAFGGPGMSAMGPMTPPSLYGGYGAAPPPPMYRGPMGQSQNFIAPPIPQQYFNTPFAANYAQTEASDSRMFGMQMAGIGVAGRGMADLGMAGVGAAIGGRFGGGRGALVGGALGFLGSEFGGLGQGGQNFAMNQFAAPAINMRAFGAGIESVSQGFMSGGQYGSLTGGGFSRNAALDSARLLEDMSNSGDFRRETGNRFNTADVMRIAQGSAQNGMMLGVQSPDEMKNRVRDIARSLQSFMELANEPDLQRAIQTMGNMRAQGLNLNETMSAVGNGRAFARMAGTTFETLANLGGGAGASTYGSLGLSQGLGMRAGMQNYGLAGMSANLGSVGPATLNMLGGVGGMANMNNMFSAGMLQMPMLAPGMMTTGGGLDPARIRALLSGRTDLMGMAGAGANTLGGMTGAMGIGGLGMAVGMQPVLQDAIGRMVAQQGPFAQRGMEDRQMMAMMRRMGLHGSEGLMTAGQMMGMSGTQSFARAQEMGDPRFFDRMHDQIAASGFERRGARERDRVARQPGAWDELESHSDLAYGVGSAFRGIGRGIRDAYASIAGGGEDETYAPQTVGEERRMRSMLHSRDFLGSRGAGVGGTSQSFYSTYSDARAVAEARGGRGLMAGLTGFMMSGNNMEGDLADMRAAGRFTSGVLNGSMREHTNAMRSLNSTFGGSQDALASFSTNAANMYNNPTSMFGGATGAGLANLAVRGGAGLLSRGLVDPGNVVGINAVRSSDQRAAYVAAMRGQSGMSDEALGQQFDSQSGRVALQASPMMRLMMTRSGMANFEAQNAANNRGFGGRANFAGSEVDAYRGLLGNGADDAGTRNRYNDISRVVGDGFGSSDAARAQSHNLMAGLGALVARGERPGEQEETQRQRREMIAEARRRGMSQENIDEAVSRVGNRNRQLTESNLVDAAQTFNTRGRSGADLLDAVAGTETGRVRSTLNRRLVEGARALSRQRNGVGDVFTGVGDSGDTSPDLERLRRNIAGANADDLDEQNPALARMVRQYQGARDERGRVAALGNIADFEANTGRQHERLVTRGNRLGRGGRAGAAWRSHSGLGAITASIGAFFSSAEDYADERMNPDDQENREQAEVSSTEGSARSAGIGGAADRLVQASESLERAAASINGAAQTGQLEGLFDREPH